MSNRILDHLLNDPENDIDLQVRRWRSAHTHTPGSTHIRVSVTDTHICVAAKLCGAIPLCS